MNNRTNEHFKKTQKTIPAVTASKKVSKSSHVY